jgi:4-amino-4-deoxy-L-arabinose transferase-like glycosyltransferase
MRAEAELTTASDPHGRTPSPIDRGSLAWQRPVVAIAALALALRLYNLSGRSLWLDEIVQARSAHVSNLKDVIAQSSDLNFNVNQMPLSYIATWLLRPLGDVESILRLPAVVEGTLGVLAVYVLGRALFGTRAGLVAALVTAVFPFEVWYSQEARSYALFMVLTTAQMYGAYSAVKRGRVIDWLALAVFTGLNLYTHYLAIFTTAAAASYIGIFLIAGLLRGASSRVKTATVSALGVVAVAAAYAPWRQIYRAMRGHTALSAAIFAAALILLALAAFSMRSRLLPAIKSRPAAVRQVGLAMLAGLLVFAAYIPWLPQLHNFLDRPEASIGRLRLDHAPGLGDVVAVMNRLGFWGFLLAAFCVGLVVVIARLFRGGAAESGILVAWLGISVLLLLRTTGSALLAIDVRYLAFLVPAAMIVIGAGIDGVALAFEWAVQRARRIEWPAFPRPATAATGLLAALMLVQALPALAASYQAPKDDWRATAQHIAALSASGSYVISLGDYSDWSVICLNYYFQRFHDPVTVIDGSKIMNSAVEGNLAGTSGSIWGIVIYPSSQQSALFDQSSAEKSDFVDVTGHLHVVRPSDSTLSADAQLKNLLAWEAPVHPPATAS